MAKGFRWRRKTNYRAAKEAVLKAGKYAHRDRRAKKRTMRSSWIVRLNNALKLNGTRYNEFIKILKDKKIEINRKVMSELAVQSPEIFKSFVEKVK